MAPYEHLVIFFHGIGASGSQLMPLASSWRSSLADFRFIAPDAPFHHARGHQWFSVDGLQLQPDRIREVRKAFDGTVGQAIATEGFDLAHERVAFVGVSQGAIVALDAVASGRWQIGALVAFAGLLPSGPISSRGRETPVLLVHGEADQTIPAFASTMAAAQLGAAGFGVELDVQPGVGHTISPEGAQKALTFLRKTFMAKAVK
ncbi:MULTISPECIES: alpha/beta hydrolase [Rhizobium]|uniref:Prolyl oligopeptidase family serine peptidase n=1 Tax=Rhizobium indicum TaxID=2583231 RepID=A0ABX6PNR4_9HYPH|nr:MULTISPECIES: prolyl oligopeptidase family serine peptidase [Rhizobium]NNU68961.1 prolyl oligopeptidase family serine peptidase [Rhizobium sp. WYCCWR 11152]QKK20274.1 prolyl oligopeptidase family serine peptidase [Rhizobium indicum]